MLMPVETAHHLQGPRQFIQGSKAMWMATRSFMRYQDIGTLLRKVRNIIGIDRGKQ
jgi:hypothetical protein